MVMVENDDGSVMDFTTKPAIEAVILESNKAKFQQSHRPFYCHPLSTDFRLKGTSMDAASLLAGV
jgi:hypothetical protein